MHGVIDLINLQLHIKSELINIKFLSTMRHVLFGLMGCPKRQPLYMAPTFSGHIFTFIILLQCISLLLARFLRDGLRQLPFHFIECRAQLIGMCKAARHFVLKYWI